MDSLSICCGIIISLCASLVACSTGGAKTYSKFSSRLEGSTLFPIHRLSLEDCWVACKERMFCKSVNYHRQLQYCELNDRSLGENSVNTLTRIKGWLFYQENHEKVTCLIVLLHEFFLRTVEHGYGEFLGTE